MNKRPHLAISSVRSCATERGEGRAKALFWTAFFLVVIFVCYKIIPPYVKDYELQEKMQETARFASAFHKGEEEIRDTIYKEIKDLDIPAKREDVKVQYDNRTIRISVQYSVPVDFLVYQRDMHFNTTSENRSII